MPFASGYWSVVVVEEHENFVLADEAHDLDGKGAGGRAGRLPCGIESSSP